MATTTAMFSLGLGHILLVTSSMTIVRAKIDMNIPRKRKGFCSQHDKVRFRGFTVWVTLQLEVISSHT